MKIDFNIFNSILFGDLRPVLNLLSDIKFKNILQPSLKGVYSSFKEFENAFSILTKKNSLISTSEDYKLEAITADEISKQCSFDILEPLIYIDFPQVTDNIYSYYKFLIDNEGTKLTGSFHKSLSLFDNDIDRKYFCSEFLDRINYYLDQTNIQFNEINQNNLKEYVLSVLKITLQRLLIETQELFPNLVASDNISFETLKTSISIFKKPVIIITSNLFKYKSKQIIECNEYSKQEIIQLIDKIKLHYITFFNSKSENFQLIELNEKNLQNIRILENYIFLNEFEIIKEKIDTDTLSDFEFESRIYEKYISKFSDFPKECNQPSKRVDFITKELLKFSRLFDNRQMNYNPDLSIPRQITNWLNSQIEYYKVNLDKDINFFSVIKKSANSVSKNNKTKEIRYAFSYKNFNKNITAITDLLNFLKEKNFVAGDTDIKDFRKIFSNSKPDNPIKWSGNLSELYYFVKLLHTELQLISNLDKNIWKVTASIFVDGQSNPYDWKKFKGQKTPASAQLIEKAVKLLD
jgi:hypothetical protein